MTSYLLLGSPIKFKFSNPLGFRGHTIIILEKKICFTRAQNATSLSMRKVIYFSLIMKNTSQGICDSILISIGFNKALYQPDDTKPYINQSLYRVIAFYNVLCSSYTLQNYKIVYYLRADKKLLIVQYYTNKRLSLILPLLYRSKGLRPKNDST